MYNIVIERIDIVFLAETQKHNGKTKNEKAVPYPGNCDEPNTES